MTDVSVLSALEAVRFLEWLDPAGLHNLVAINPVSKAVESQTFDASQRVEMRCWIQERTGKVNLYFSVNEPRADARRDSKLRRDEIGAVRAFHVDIDNLEGEPDWDMDCMPSAVIDSGGGRWGLWRLAEPMAVNDVAAIEAQNRALTARFHGDSQAHNLDRIARLPGTLNIPNEAKRKKGRTEAMSRVVTVKGPVYSVGEVAAWCPPAPYNANVVNNRENNNADLGVELDTSANTSRAIKWLVNEAPVAELGNGSNGTTYQVAAKVKDFGVSQSAAFELILDWWNELKSTPPWPAAKLQAVVAHAYRYGTAAAGKLAPSLAESEFEAVELPETAPKPTRRKMEAEEFDAITEDFGTTPTHLIDGWCDQGAMIVTYGESNSGKTHVVLDQSMAIAAGRTWAGKKTHQGLVVYVAAEGGRGVRRRVMAHKLFRPEHKGLPFALISFPIDLNHNAADAKALVALVKAQEAHFGQKCVMVVVDTLSRALAGGDENSSADMGAFVKRCDEIRAATGAALHVVHHAGKNTAKGARGHSLLRAAVDTEIEIENGAILCRKQRDMEAAGELRFSYKPVQIGVRFDGAPVTSVVLEVWETSEFDVSLTPQTQKVLEAAQALITQKMQIDTSNNCPNFAPKELGVFGATGGTLDRAIVELLGQGQIVKYRRGLYKLKNCPIAPALPQA